jgi:hypothetical protein
VTSQRPSTSARLLMVAPPAMAIVGAAIALVADSRFSLGYMALIVCGAIWLYTSVRVRVEWNDDRLRVVNYLRSHVVPWNSLDDVEVGYTTSALARGVPFAVPKLVLAEGREIRIAGFLGASKLTMDRFVDDVTLLTEGRAQGVSQFRSYSPWCKPSALRPNFK